MAAKKKKTATKTYGNKTKFVLGLPRDMSAKDVVAEGKKQGITITEAHVYKIRSTNKDKVKGPVKAGRASKSAVSARGRKAAAKSAGKPSSSMSKRDFVMSFGPETKASEILRQAKEAGIGLSKAYLYTIRSAGAAAPAKRGRKPSASTGTLRKEVARVRSDISSLETQFIDAAIDMGLSKATDLLERLRTRLKNL